MSHFWYQRCPISGTLSRLWSSWPHPANFKRFSMKVGHVLEETWNYLLCKLGACPSKTEDVRRKCPNSGSTVPFLVQMGQQEKPLVLREIWTQSPRRWYANQVSGELQCGLCLKLIEQIFAENQVSLSGLSHFRYFSNMRSGSYDPHNLQGGCAMLRAASAVSRPTARKHLISLLRNICASPGGSASMKNARFAHGVNSEWMNGPRLNLPDRRRAVR